MCSLFVGGLEESVISVLINVDFVTPIEVRRVESKKSIRDLGVAKDIIINPRNLC